jgi:hypothetical protein
MKKPIGIYLFSIFHLIVGATFLWLSINYPQIDIGLSKTGVSPALYRSVFYIISFVLIISSVGLFLGKKIGWYLATFFYAIFLIENIISLFSNPRDFLGFSLINIKNNLRVIWLLAFILYFSKQSVLEYLTLAAEGKYKRIGVVMAIALMTELSFDYITG